MIPQKTSENQGAEKRKTACQVTFKGFKKKSSRATIEEIKRRGEIELWIFF